MIEQRNFWIYLLLTIITCGLYSIYFWYVYTEDINKICSGDGQESMNYILVLLLSIVTCGIYGFYWYYKQGNRLQEAAPRYNLMFSESGTTILLWLILGAFICGLGSFVGLYILITNLNRLAEVYNQQIYNETQY